MVKEDFKFSAQELDSIFHYLDDDKDGFINRKDWNKIMRATQEAIYKFHDLIRKNSLEIEDLLFRMQIDSSKNERFNFFQFKSSKYNIY